MSSQEENRNQRFIFRIDNTQNKRRAQNDNQLIKNTYISLYRKLGKQGQQKLRV
ncbi:unnamed protein product [Paramecium octaurelia]|uniref:Uncharacterized protein n=1 Tax=Paramecium octaurelia TaxID=43137 RepID=A0A8S1WI44_PAROT|nr:unnamed protein product [Paramecium octaurelia]